MLTRILSKIKYFSSHSVHPNELQPGDHIYVWRNMKHIMIYQHHGIYLGNNRCIHFTTRADAIAANDKSKQNDQNEVIEEKKEQNSNDVENQNKDIKQQSNDQIIKENVLKYDKDSKQFEVQKQEIIDIQDDQAEQKKEKKSFLKWLDPSAKTNKAVIMETDLDYFIYGGKLKRARYNTGFLEYLLKSAGTCYRYQRVDASSTIEAAKKYVCPINSKGQKEIYSLHKNNCEHLVLEWTTGKRQSDQLYRFFRRILYFNLFFFPVYKVTDHVVIDAFENYIKATVIYENILSHYIYLATFIL